MVGLYQRNKMKNTIMNWLKSNLNVSEYGFNSIHLDELLVGAKSTKHALFDAYKKSVGYLIEKKVINEIVPILVIPLGYSERIELDYSLDFDAADEPASLYLMDRRLDMCHEGVEEYCKVVIIDDLECENYRAMYRCYRDEESILNGWEFSRAVYIKYYPNDLIVGNQK